MGAREEEAIARLSLMEATNLKRRIDSAVEIIGAFGGHDGGHHKQWVLDQVLRALLTPEQYETWVNRIDGREWDQGIPP